MKVAVSQFVDGLGWIPLPPCPFYVWQFWKWQKVRCQCGATFISRNLGEMPPEYELHWMLEHSSQQDS